MVKYQFTSQDFEKQTNQIDKQQEVIEQQANIIKILKNENEQLRLELQKLSQLLEKTQQKQASNNDLLGIYGDNPNKEGSIFSLHQDEKNIFQSNIGFYPKVSFSGIFGKTQPSETNNLLFNNSFNEPPKESTNSIFVNTQPKSDQGLLSGLQIPNNQQFQESKNSSFGVIQPSQNNTLSNNKSIFSGLDSHFGTQNKTSQLEKIESNYYNIHSPLESQNISNQDENQNLQTKDFLEKQEAEDQIQIFSQDEDINSDLGNNYISISQSSSLQSKNSQGLQDESQVKQNNVESSSI